MNYALSWLDLPPPAAARISADAPSSRDDSHFSEELCRFIQAHLRSFDAVEMLILMHGSPDRNWSIDELTGAVRPPLGGRREIAAQMARFVSGGMVTVDMNRYCYKPRTPAIRSAVDALVRAHNERPVSLVRLIYYLRNHKVESFAEAFRIGRD